MIATSHERAEDANLALGLVDIEVAHDAITRQPASSRQHVVARPRRVWPLDEGEHEALEGFQSRLRARERVLGVLAEPDTSLEQEVRDEREIPFAREQTPGSIPAFACAVGRDPRAAAQDAAFAIWQNRPPPTTIQMGRGRVGGL